MSCSRDWEEGVLYCHQTFRSQSRAFHCCLQDPVRRSGPPPGSSFSTSHPCRPWRMLFQLHPATARRQQTPTHGLLRHFFSANAKANKVCIKIKQANRRYNRTVHRRNRAHQHVFFLVRMNTPMLILEGGRASCPSCKVVQDHQEYSDAHTPSELKLGAVDGKAKQAQKQDIP